MGPDTIIKKSLIWLARRGKSVSKHISLHNSTREAAGRTRPWILEKATHSITRGGDRVSKNLIERTLKDADSYALQANGRHAFSKEFGRQIGRDVDQTALRVIVNNAGKIVTAYAVTAAQALATIAALTVLDEALSDTIESLDQITASYDPKAADRDESSVEAIIDFFSDLGNDSLGKHEFFYVQMGHLVYSKEQQYLSRMQELGGQTFDGDERNRVLSSFREAIACAAAPYLDDDA